MFGFKSSENFGRSCLLVGHAVSLVILSSSLRLVAGLQWQIWGSQSLELSAGTCRALCIWRIIS